MKVALLGAPGAGKSKIARRVVARLNKENKEWKVVDNYVDKLFQYDTHLSATRAGFNNDYRDAINVIATRWIEEDKCLGSSITCGSIYESIIYASGPSMRIPLLNEVSMLQESRVAQVMMQAFGICEQRYFDYDVLLYLPLLPKEEDEQDWEDVINAKIPEVLEGFGKYAVTLKGTDRQRVDQATEIIQYAAASDAGT